MKVWEAHRDLSLSLGDSVGLEDYTTDSPPDIIPDGVRNSKALRDSYLYRAMLSILNDMLRQVIGLDKKQASEIVNRMFPHMIVESTVPVSSLRKYTWLNISSDDLGGRKLLYLLSVILTNNDNKNYPIPIKSQHEKNSLMNSRNIQRPDAFCTYMTQIQGTLSDPNTLRLFIYDGTDLLYDNHSIILNFLPYPLNPANQELSDELSFEMNYYNTLIELATVFGMAESQDLQAPERFYPHTLDTKIGTNNAGKYTQQ